MVADTVDVDARALALRSQGMGFRTIANELGFEQAAEANLAFNRALRLLPEEERNAVRQAEGGRLDRLAEVTRANQTLSPTDVERRLKRIDRLRDELHAD